MFILITLFYIIVVLQHLYFNNKTSSAHSSSINVSESLSDSSSLRIEFNMSFDWSWYWSVSPRMIGNDWKCCFFPQFRYVCWEVFIAANSRKIKVGGHCFRTFRVNLMYVNLTFGKFALILCNVNFLRVVRRASLI